MEVPDHSSEPTPAPPLPGPISSKPPISEPSSAVQAAPDSLVMPKAHPKRGLLAVVLLLIAVGAVGAGYLLMHKTSPTSVSHPTPNTTTNTVGNGTTDQDVTNGLNTANTSLKSENQDQQSASGATDDQQQAISVPSN